ncbi:MAG: RNA ligase [Pseudomonadota bacterium]
MQIEIRTIDDVLPHIREDSGIIVSERADHSVIDYVYTTDDTFSSDMALQCRGLKFDAAGRIIARPFHKFFNLGEREDPMAVDWSRPHHVVDKLDGTMVHAARLNGELVFMTRMGVMKQARDAFAVASDGVRGLCEAMLDASATPLFEYTAPDNRIVVAYEVPRLTLLAVREMVSGRYMDDADLRALGTHYQVSVAARYGTVDNIRTFMTEARALEGVEGYVIVFEDGHRIKLKADGYVLRHRALSGAQLEKNVLAWVLADAVDDVIPLLAPDVAERVVAYQSDVNTALARRVAKVEAFVREHRSLERKDFARAAQASLDKALMPGAFAALDGRDIRTAVKKHLVWAAHSQTRIDAVRALYGLSWSTEGLVAFDPG